MSMSRFERTKPSRRRASAASRALRLACENLEDRLVLDATYQSLAAGPLSQNWSNIGLITTNDDWSGVPSIIGYLGENGANTTSDIDPRTIVDSRTNTPTVTANQGQAYLDNQSAAGGVAEVEIANPTVALNGSGTADSPFLLFHVNTTGLAGGSKVRLRYNVRDLDATADSAVQQVVAQYRIGTSGNFTNIDGTYIADATTGPNLASLVTPVDVYLPDAVLNNPQVQIRVMTTNALGNDEAIGVDDIVVSGETSTNAGTFNFAPTAYKVAEAASAAVTLTVARSGGFTGAVTVPYTFANGAATNGSDFTGTNGNVSFAAGETSKTIVVPILNDANQEANETFTVTLGAPSAGSLGSSTTATVTITDDDLNSWILANGPLTQDWSDTGLITTNNVWDNVPAIRGYRGDGLTGSTGTDPQTILAPGTFVINVTANQGQALLNNTSASGGLAEFEASLITDTTPGVANSTIALNGSGTANAPHLVISLDTTGVNSTIGVSYNLRDLDSSTDNAVQQFALQYRIGNSGNFVNIPAGYVSDASEGPSKSGKVTAVSATLPAAAQNQPLVQVRIITSNAVGNDEWVGVDDIVVQQIVNNPGVIQFAAATVSADEGNSGTRTATFTVQRTGGTSGAVSVAYATIAGGTATAGVDYQSASGTLSWADGESAAKTFTVTINGDADVEADETVFVQLSAPTGGATVSPSGNSSTLTILNKEDKAFFPIAGGPLSVNWSNTALIATDGNWSGYANVAGFLGAITPDLGSGTDPQTITDELGFDSQLNVIANQTNADTLSTGGVAEFQLADPTVALNGSGTADAPNLVFYIDATGVTTGVNVSYRLRDLDGSADNAVSPVALQYRIGASGPYINVPAAFVADATTGPSLLGPDTLVTATLPAAVNGQSQVYIRILTTNAVGSDEWIGVDDVVISASAANAPGTVQFGAPTYSVEEGNAGTNSVSVTVTRSGGTLGAITVPFSIAGTATSGVDYQTISPTSVTFADGDGATKTITINVIGDVAAESDETITLTIGTVTGGATVGSTASTTVTILNQDDKAFFALSGGPLSINWSNTALISADNNWSGYANVVGILGAITPDLAGGTDPQTVVTDLSSGGGVNVFANQTNADTFGTGGVAEFQIADPTIALNGSGTADAPHLVFTVDATGVTNVTVAYRLRDLDGSADNAVSPVALQYRIGTTGDYINVPAAYRSDVTAGPSLLGPDTLVTATLPAAVNGQSQVYIRILTTNAVGSDEWIGVDDVVISGTSTAAPGTVQFGSAAYSTNEGNSGTTTVSVTVTRTGGSSGAITVPFTVGGTATSGTDYQAITPLSVSFADGDAATKTISVVVIGDTVVEANETVVLTIGTPTGGATVGGTNSTTVTILNDDVAATPGTVQFGSAAYSTNEGNSGTTTVSVTVTRTGGSTGAITVPFTVGGTATSGTDYQAITPLSVSFADGDAATKTISVVVIGDTVVEANETVVLTIGTPTGGATVGGTNSTTVTILNDDVATSTFQVSSLVSNPSGFVATFNAPLDASDINLYNTEDASLGVPDVVVTDPFGQPVLGSLLFTGTTVQFVATGGALADGDYSVTLRSASNGFKSTTGGLLDGNSNGTPGDSYTTTFNRTTAALSRTFTVGDFVLGPDQSTAAPIPVVITNGAGVTAITMQVFYNPALFTVTGVTVFPDNPGYSPSVNFATPGQVNFSFSTSQINALPAGPITLFAIDGFVPASAAYGSKGTFRPNVTQLAAGFTQIATRYGDYGMQVVAFGGDVSGDGFQDGFDGFVLNEFSVGNIDGVSAYQNADLNLIGDISGDGFADSFDGFLLNELAVGNPIPFPLPPVPDTVPNFGGGPDPILGLPRGLSLSSGVETLVPIRLDYVDARSATLQNADVLIGFDSSKLEIVGVRGGTFGGDYVVKYSVDGDVVRVSLGGTLSGRHLSQGDSGALAYLVVKAKPGVAGDVALNMLQQGKVDGRIVSTRLNAGRLVLGEAPTNGVDANDGLLTVAAVDQAIDAIVADDLFGSGELFVPTPAAFEESLAAVAIRKRNRAARTTFVGSN